MDSNFSACRFNKAIVRAPASSVVNGLRAGDGENPTFSGIQSEHQAYVTAMQAAGVEVTELPALEAFPDSIFVEDPALVFPQAAILLRSAAPTRAGEADAIRNELEAAFQQVHVLPTGGYADGGDVLVTRDKVLIGLSNRTDLNGAQALSEILQHIGHRAEIVKTPATILHFKSDCGLLDDETVLTTARLAQTGVFDGMDHVITPAGEEAVANSLSVNGHVLLGDQFPRTADILDRRGYKIVPVPISEIAKIDAGLSCMSLRWMSHSA